jgi:heptosyltransferase-1
MPSVLLIKMSSLGDVVHNLPVVTDLKRSVPDVHVNWVVEEGFAEVPALHPGVERVIPVALRRWRRQLLTLRAWHEIGALRQAVRRPHYDLVIDTQGLVKSALVAALADGPSAGPDWRSAREPLASLLYGRTFAVTRDQHAVTRNRELAAHAFGYKFDATAPDYGLRARINTDDLAGLPARYAVCLHGTARDAKRWPNAHWVELGRLLAARNLTPLFSWGNDQEHARSVAIGASIPEVYVPPKRLGLRELPGILKNADVVVGVDTGLMHLAVALDRPTVAIYVDSWPRLSGAFPRDPARAISLGGQGQPPTVDEVAAAISRLGFA